MMPSFTLTNMAKDDLKEIGRYTQKRWGRDQRDQYLTMLDTCFSWQPILSKGRIAVIFGMVTGK